MNIKTSKIKLYVIALAVMAGSLSATAFAAKTSGPIVSLSAQQPYLVAFKGSDATLDTKDIKMKVISDAFIATSYTPVNATPAIPVGRIGAGVTFSSSPAVREMFVTTTGYNSLVEQTDSTPFIAADGTRTYDGMVAANFLPFGTKIRIPDYYGDKVFEVHDRMAKRFSNRVDVWFEHKSDAMKWGRRTVRIEILGS